jgi:hypothetical protein
MYTFIFLSKYYLTLAAWISQNYWKNFKIFLLIYSGINIFTKLSQCKLQFLMLFYLSVMIKAKSHDRPGQSLRVPTVRGSQITRKSAYEGGKIFKPYAPAIFTPLSRIIPGTHFCWVPIHPTAIARPEGLYQWKIPVTPMGIEPATYRFVAQHLKKTSSSRTPSKMIQRRNTAQWLSTEHTETIFIINLTFNGTYRNYIHYKFDFQRNIQELYSL